MRIPNWEFSLIDAVEKGSREPFQYGVNDCLFYVLNCVAAITGDLPKCPQYKNANAARVAFGRIKIKTLGDYLATQFTELESPLQAMRGDVGVIAQNDQECCVVNIGDCWVGKGESGSVRVPLRSVKRCFKVE